MDWERKLGEGEGDKRIMNTCRDGRVLTGYVRNVIGVLWKERGLVLAEGGWI